MTTSWSTGSRPSRCGSCTSTTQSGPRWRRGCTGTFCRSSDLRDPLRPAPANVVALADHRRPVAAALEEVVRHLAVAATRAIVLTGAAVQEVRGPHERLALPDRGVARLQPPALDQLRDVVLVGAVLLAAR